MSGGRKVVVVDPGHGGRDPGAVDPVEPRQGDVLATREDEIAYDIALQARRALEAAGLTVRLTRVPGQFVSLQERCDAANRADAVAFVSIHVNAAGNPTAAGIETFSYPGAAAGAELRDAVHREVLRLAPEFADRGAKTAKHYVTRHVKAPACLLECGFCTNVADERRLHDPYVRERIARGVANGVAAFLGATVQDNQNRKGESPT